MNLNWISLRIKLNFESLYHLFIWLVRFQEVKQENPANLNNLILKTSDVKWGRVYGFLKKIQR